MKLVCPSCGQDALLYEPAEDSQTSGPPSAWSEGRRATCECEECGWEAFSPDEYAPLEREV